MGAACCTGKSSKSEELARDVIDQIHVKIRTINGIQKKLIIQPGATILTLKEIIYKKITDSLEVQDMKLYYEGKVMLNSNTVQSYIGKISSPLVEQRKKDLADIPGIKIQKQDDDQLCEPVIKMKCGHYMGRDNMVALLLSTLNSNNCQIRCPFKTNEGQACGMLWDYAQCKKIGVLTKEQKKRFEDGLDQFWKYKNSNICPRCNETVYKQNENSDLLQSSCGYDFCIKCLKEWQDYDVKFCSACKQKANMEILKVCEWTCKLRLYKNSTDKIQTVFLPSLRACPNCHVIYNFVKGCKHIKCQNCPKYFCWVCLQTTQNTYQWKCKGSGEFCGSVAQTQCL